MLLQIHQSDNQIFESIVQKFKEKSYQELLTLPEREQLVIDALSEHTTIEVTQQFYEIDSAVHITISQFFWLSEINDPSLITGMHNISIPLPNSNDKLFYSGHCKTEFFYALPNNIITDDIFIRNDFAEEIILEQANWFGQTGLSDPEERMLPKYVRYEYGDLLVDEDGLKAHDLTFLGCYPLNSQLIKLLRLDTSSQPTQIYIWHYYDNHYAYAYHNANGILEYEIGNQYPLEQLQLAKQA
ncbi:hypothetical protein [Wohlfahrtiimonas larvae]|uniref:Uncharacterized protein n=1 Tax=Wohlfahrtiimonas larvae TaxID=1157986 RepID=A0ABP9MDG9_9GAMM|nr:hypothetical protein [Wohlfahrtiimonas larvae]